eukprot:TRINITY_DN963_c0_g1_i1.p1 TRINITY_DN963_c0_g1~~TRINITY_DN963_c0_g1_i1.p1  ORF type:complete len:168 (+),score=56.48 TRINITY_DN963_c0_g1_i1:234-737(+)
MWGPDDLLRYMSNHPMIVLVVLFFLYQRWKSNQVIPDVPGAKVVSIESLEHWNTIQQEAQQAGKIVLVDFYATWCPPCRTAAPVFGAMSMEYDEKKVLFAKCNVDAVRAVMQLAEVSAMPTFQVWKDGSKLKQVQGWQESAVRLLLAEQKVGFGKTSAEKTNPAKRE